MASVTAPDSPARSPDSAAAVTDAPVASSSDAKGKRKRAVEEEPDEDEEDADTGEEPQWHKDGEGVVDKTPAQGDWQAVWANTYYFWNQKTNETTWTNPLESATQEPEASSSSNAKAKATTKPDDYGGIDPDLVFLDPSLAYGPRQAANGIQQARFNSRTGRFEGADARTPGHISEIERYKRQSAFFFDVEGWEKQTDAEQERRKAELAAGKDPDANKHRAPTKAELARYKERAKEKKKAKQAWLYD